MKIRVTAEVRRLLVELDQAFEKFDAVNAICSDRSVGDAAAMQAGADREHYRTIISGIAYQIRIRSTGRKFPMERLEGR